MLRAFRFLSVDYYLLYYALLPIQHLVKMHEILGTLVTKRYAVYGLLLL